MSWKKLLESTSESVNDHLRLRHDYLVAENRILRNQIDGRVQLTDSERKELAEIGAKLGKQALAEIATVAQADTILAWHRKFATQTVDTSTPPQSVGRPRVAQEIEAWVIRMARENLSWGYDRIQGSLNHLGYTISDQTVGNILKRHGIPPAPERQKTVTWREFIRCHWDVFVATGFFNDDIWSWFGPIVTFLMSLIYCSRHQVQSVWMALHQEMLGLKVLMRQPLDWRHYAPKWARLSKQGAHSKRSGQMSLKQKLSEVVLADACKTRSQDVSMVMDLSAMRFRKIRDGPIAYRHQLNLLSNRDRKAA